MAVSPLRALVAAQAQSTWNRLLREGGEASVVAAGLVALLAAVAVAPPAFAIFLSGLGLGRGFVGAGLPLAGTAGGLQVLLLSLALLAGLLEHRVSYSADGFRAYPVPRVPLFVAELLAGLLGLLTLFGTACGLALTVGLCVGAPRGAPLFLIVGLQAIAWLALVQHLVGTAKRRLAGAGRSTLLGAGLAALLAASLLGRDLATVANIRATFRAVAAVLSYSPLTLAYRGVEQVLGGAPVPGLLRQLPLLAATGLLFLLALWVHFRPEGPAREARSGPARLWSFRSPVTGLARVFLSQILSSRSGRVALLLPLVASACLALSVVAASEAQGRLRPQDWPIRIMEWLVRLPLLGVFLAYLPTMDEIWRNQFGGDGPGIRGLFLLPLQPEQLLLGRLFGLFGFAVLQSALGVAPLLLVYRATLAEVLWGLAAAGTVFLVLAGCGHVISARFPRPLGEKLLGAGATPLTEFLIPIAVQLPLFAVLVITYKTSAALLGAWGPALGMVALLGLTVYGYRRVLPFLAARVMALRETLVEELA